MKVQNLQHFYYTFVVFSSFNFQASVEQRIVPHITFTDWDDKKGTPKSPTNFLTFINHVEKVSREYTDNGPILLHCM